MGGIKAKQRPWIAQIIPFRYQRWPCTKQPSWKSSNKFFFKTIMSSWAETRQHWDSEQIKSFYSVIKDGHSLNSNLDILQTGSSKPYVLMSKDLIGCIRPKRDSDMLHSFHSDTKDGHALNSLYGIFKQLLPTHIFSWAETWWEASCNLETQNR